MASLSAEERTALRDAVTRLLADRSTEADVRRTMETASGYDEALWAQLSDMGVAGLVIEEAYGGAGAGPLELENVMEAAGASLLCAPLLGSSVLAAGLLQGLDDAEAKARLLPGMAAGTTLAAAALTGDAGSWSPEGVAVSASAGGALSGLASYVLHGQNAGVLLVLAHAPDGLAVFEVAPDAAGVEIAALPTFDHTLRLARITFEETPARRLQGAAWPAVQAALDLALVALAGDQAGGAQRCLAFTVDYAKTRFQFGRAIGSFQAIKHILADMYVSATLARSNCYYGAWALASGAAELPVAAATARVSATTAFQHCSKNNIQVHGGMGFTWAFDCHLYYRRSNNLALALGSLSTWEAELIDRMSAGNAETAA